MPFPARFAGTCGNCHKSIEIGQYIGWNRRGVKKLYHTDCQNPNAIPTETTEIKLDNGSGTEMWVEELATATNELPNSMTLPPPIMVDTSKPKANVSDAALSLTQAIQAIASQSVSVEKVEEIATKKFQQLKQNMEDAMLRLIVDNQKPKELVITRTEGDTRVSTNVGHAHKNFELLVKVASAHTNETPVNIWLTGPAGSGKTHAASQLAKSLNLEFGFSGAIMEPYSLLGYMDANGKLVRTSFRERYEFGGVFLQDEIDGSSANGLLPFNAALANGHCAFPDGVITRHKDCIIIAAANTFGLGGTSDYVGRVKLDAATLSRYVFIDWPYDEELERTLAGNQSWVTRVQTVRHKAQTLGLKLLITPRATYTGAKLLASGIPQPQVEKMVLKQGMTDAQWNQIGGN